MTTFARDAVGRNCNARLYSLEGIDGAGKSTQVAPFMRILRGNRESLGSEGAVRTREPDMDTGLGVVMRLILSKQVELNIQEKELRAQTYQTLFTVDRLLHWKQFIRKKLVSNIDVVTDRYIPSTLAYAYAGGADMKWIQNLHDHLGIPNADLTFYLRIDPKAALDRLTARGGITEIFEKLGFLKKVAEAYERQAEQNKDSWIVVDATLPKRKVTEVMETEWKAFMSRKGWFHPKSKVAT